MSRFEINSWVRKKTKQMSGGETYPRREGTEEENLVPVVKIVRGTGEDSGR